MSLTSPRDLYLVSVGDPGIDRSGAPQTEAIELYARRRTVDTLAAVRMFTAPTVFRIRALNPIARTRALSMGGVPAPGDRYSPGQLLAAVRYGVVSVIREAPLVEGVPNPAPTDLSAPPPMRRLDLSGGTPGVEETLPTEPGLDPPMITDAALNDLAACYGGAALDELGALILDRSAMHPRRAADFSLPRSALALI